MMRRYRYCHLINSSPCALLRRALRAPKKLHSIFSTWDPPWFFYEWSNECSPRCGARTRCRGWCSSSRMLPRRDRRPRRRRHRRVQFVSLSWPRPNLWQSETDEIAADLAWPAVQLRQWLYCDRFVKLFKHMSSRAKNTIFDSGKTHPCRRRLSVWRFV